MNFKNEGLTIGELIVTIGILILAGLIWSNLGKREDSKESLAPTPTIKILNSKSI